MKTGQQELDRIQNANWDSLLKIFHAINGTSEQKKEKYNALKELSKTKQLSPRQAEGISDRCNYRIHSIDNPKEKPFSNNERKDENKPQFDKSQSNGKSL